MRRLSHNNPGAPYFFIVNLANTKLSLLVDNIELLKEAIRHLKMTHPYEIVVMVEIPDATRWASIKAGFSRGLPKNERISKSRQSRGERGIWQRRYWEHPIRDDDDLVRHIDYIHHRPVKHGYVSRAADWPHASPHQYTRGGIVPSDCAREEIRAVIVGVSVVDVGVSSLPQPTGLLA